MNHCFNIIQNRIKTEIQINNANLVLPEQLKLQEPTYIIPYFFILLCGILEMCLIKLVKGKNNGRTT